MEQKDVNYSQWESMTARSSVGNLTPFAFFCVLLHYKGCKLRNYISQPPVSGLDSANERHPCEWRKVEEKLKSYCVCDKYRQLHRFQQMVGVWQGVEAYFSVSPTLVLHAAEVLSVYSITCWFPRSHKKLFLSFSKTIQSSFLCEISPGLESYVFSVFLTKPIRKKDTTGMRVEENCLGKRSY